MASTKLPAFQFYPGDWRKDPGIQSLDYEARGVWFECLCFMHESGVRGRMCYPSGEPMDDAAIAQSLGIEEAKWKQIKSKLLARGVAHVNGDGAVYNKRMVEDEALRKKRAEAGRKGGKASK